MEPTHAVAMSLIWLWIAEIARIFAQNEFHFKRKFEVVATNIKHPAVF